MSKVFAMSLSGASERGAGAVALPTFNWRPLYLCNTMTEFYTLLYRSNQWIKPLKITQDIES